MSQAGLINSKGGGGGGNVQTLTGNTGGAVGPTANNINLVGATLYTTAGNPGTSTLTVEPLPNAYPITPYVVGPVGAAGYQTIQSAINAANVAGGGIVYIQPGTYTENLTFFDKIQLNGTQAYENSLSTVIIGTHIAPLTGAIAIANVELQNAGDIFASIAAGSSTISIINSTFNITTSGWIWNLPNWTGNGFNINNSGAANLFFNNCQIGAGTVNTLTTNATQARFDLTFVVCPVAISGSGLTLGLLTVFGNTLTVNGSANVQLFLGDFLSLTAGVAAIIANSTLPVILNEVSIN